MVLVRFPDTNPSRLQMWRLLVLLTAIDLTLAVLRRDKACVNGEKENEQCFCKDGWTGALCHRRMNCDGYERETNGS